MGTDAPRAPLDQDAIAKKISQYWRVQVVEVTESTQDDLAVAVTIADALAGDVIAAEYQSKGRGRLDRTFEAAKSSALMFSFFITPQRDKSYWSFLPLLTGLAAHDALESLDNNVEIDIKWPNDLFIDGKKTAGIIAQTVGDGVVIGIGINVGMNESELPVPTATSLGIHSYRELDRNKILIAFLATFERYFSEWDKGYEFVDEYTAVLSTIGKDVEIQLPGGELKHGKVDRIDHHGALILTDGTAITAGDVIHLR